MTLAAVDPSNLTPLDTHRWLVQQSISGTLKWLASAKTKEQMLESGDLPAFDKDVHARLAALWR